MDQPAVQDQEKFRMNIWVPQAVHEDLLEIKRSQGGSVTDTVRQALRTFMKDFEAQGAAIDLGALRFRMNVWVPQKIHEDLIELKCRYGGSITDYVRQALAEYIDRFKRENSLE